MSTINKAILIPLLSAIALFIKQSFGYEISEEWINVAADVILYIIFFLGLFMKPKKDKLKEENDDFTTPIENRV
ncbi:hypothetical protein [Paenibacillus sp. L3-i20]|uniref:hypothetical protein n=1 Tax=Paenibacillus sp. L3-i20 TaxID=2905833 RepID=UPI001EDEFA0F|nr:hypothetical protein [Paenibacillus sp. L3-i20]GKU76834.1 hypothetical protein L3i20_v212310 [Paenibacillus sp. L3-i20]